MRIRHCFVAAAVLAALTAAPLRAADDSAAGKAVVEKAIEAHGGAANLDKLKSVTWKGKGTVHIGGNPISFTAEWAAAFPDRYRVHVDTENFNFTSVFANDKAWRQIAGGDADEVDGDDLKEQRNAVHENSLVRLTPLLDKAYTLTPVPDAVVAGKPAAGVKASRDGFESISLYFDKQSNLLTKIERMALDPQSGEKKKQETFYGDFKDVGGAKWAHKVVVKRDGEVFVESDVTSLTPAAKIDDTLFRKPGGN